VTEEAAVIKELPALMEMLKESRKLPPEERIDAQCRMFANFMHRHGKQVPDDLIKYLNH
jgi:hypothetical protein